MPTFKKWRLDDEESDLNPAYVPVKKVESINPDGLDK